ncbi:MAG TPA: type II toxin-antitoxin system PemK/MazF family toxin [archaeon]|nr:type II toxin-antitoxin system PemK/MazF family toxin [archaeon]
MFNSGDIVLAIVQFADSFEVKVRPSVVLYGNFGNIVIAGITSNTDMKGIQLTKADGMVKDSVIKTNYIFTISELMVKKKLFSLNKEKRIELYSELVKNLSDLKS